MYVIVEHHRRRHEEYAFWTFRGLVKHLAARDNRVRRFVIYLVPAYSKPHAIRLINAGPIWKYPSLYIHGYKGHTGKRRDMVLSGVPDGGGADETIQSP